MAKQIKVDGEGKVYLGGGFFSPGERVGRVDSNGNVFKGGGGFFGSENKVGRVDSNGNVFEGGGGFFGSENKAAGWTRMAMSLRAGAVFFGSESRVGKVDSNGNISRHGSGRIGKAEGSNKQRKGGAAILLLYERAG